MDGITVWEAIGYVATAVGAAIAGVKGNQYAREKKAGEPLRNGRLDAILRMAQAQENFANRMTEFTIHVQEQHGAHKEEQKKQTEILGQMSQTLAGCKVLLENRR